MSRAPDDYPYSNYHLYGIHNPLERWTWITYYLLVISSSLLGNTLVLVAISRGDVFKLSKTLVILIQHIAVCDILTAMLGVPPRVVTLILDTPPSTARCVEEAYSTYYLYPASILFICALTVFKWLYLKFPMRVRGLSRTNSHVICGCIWAVSSTWVIVFMSVDYSDYVFDWRKYGCEFKYSADIWLWLKPLMSSITAFIPTIIVVLTSVPSVLYLIEAMRVSRRTRSKVRWKGVLIVVLAACVYMLSFLPYTVYKTLEPALVRPGHHYFYRTASALLSLNVAANFYIYLIAIPRFRKFVMGRVSRKEAHNDCTDFRTGVEHGVSVAPLQASKLSGLIIK